MFTKKYKILTVCLSDSEGGLELAVVQYAKVFSEEGADSALVCLPGSLIEKKARELNIQVFTVPKSRLLFFNFLTVRKIIKSWQPDTITCHRSAGIKLAALQKIFRPQLKVISIMHSLININKKDLLHRFLYKKIDKVIVLTELHKENILRHLPFSGKQIEVISHSVDQIKFNPKCKSSARKQINLPTDEFIIGCVGRFDSQKGQLELIDAADKLKKMGYKFKLVFVGQDTKGEPGGLARAKERTMQYGLQPCVQFHPQTDSIALFYQSFDLFVMPSYEETFGLVLIEAMLCGCLCLATNRGGPLEILDHGQSGLLCEPRSGDSLAAAMAPVLAHPQKFEDIRIRGYKKALVLSDERRFRENLDKAVEGL